MQGLKGEEIVDDTVWVVKTHSPWHVPLQEVFQCQKVIGVVRNPLDTIISFLHLCAQCNHTAKAEFEYEVTYPNYWNWWVHDMASQIRQWYNVVLDDAKARKVPVLFLRFEDLVTDPHT